jgi:hypothetical protein
MAFPMNTKTLLSALACACALSSNATPILDVEFWQNEWEYELKFTGIDLPSPPTGFFVDGFQWLGQSSSTFFVAGGGVVLLPRQFETLQGYQPGEHTVWLEFSDGSKLFGDQTYTIVAPTTLDQRPPLDVPDGGSSAMLAGFGLIGLMAARSLKRHPSTD